MAIPPIIGFVFGIIYGSFLNVLLWRLPEGQGIGGRSHCRSCHHTLAWYDLVPIFSFIALGGKCRYCRTRIHPRYPLVELSTGAALGLFFAIRQPMFNIEAVVLVGMLLVLTSLFFFDLFYFILPDVILLPSIIGVVLYDTAAVQKPVGFLMTGLLSAAFFAILYAVYGSKKMGFGDVKLAFFIGILLGYPLGFFAIVGGVWLAALTGIVLLLAKKASFRDPIPLGSFLTLATLTCIIFEHALLPLTTFFR